MTRNGMKQIVVLGVCVVWVAVVLISGGCVSTGGSLAIADKAAMRFLQNFNSSELARRYGGPFGLHEYSRSVSRGVDPSCGKRGVRVDYELERKVKFTGQVRRFTVWVWQGERGKVARVSGGR